MESKSAVVTMSKDMAMKTLGLTGLQGPNKGKAKGVNDYSEEEINKAFQTECRNLSKFKWDHYNVKLNLLPKILVLSFRLFRSPKNVSVATNREMICSSRDREVSPASELS